MLCGGVPELCAPRIGDASKVTPANPPAPPKGKKDQKDTPTTLKAAQGVKGKGKARQSPQTPAPTVSKRTAPVEEILISSDEEQSIATYYSSGPEEGGAPSQAKEGASGVQGGGELASRNAAERSPDPAVQEPTKNGSAQEHLNETTQNTPRTEVAQGPPEVESAQQASKEPVALVDAEPPSKSPVQEAKTMVSEPLAVINASARSSLSRSPARFLSRTPSPAALGDGNAGFLQQLAAAAETESERLNPQERDEHQARNNDSTGGPIIETQQDSPMEMTDDDDDDDSRVMDGI